MYKIFIYFQNTSLFQVFELKKNLCVKEEKETIERFSAAFPSDEGYSVKLAKVEHSVNFVNH